MDTQERYLVRKSISRGFWLVPGQRILFVAEFLTTHSQKYRTRTIELQYRIRSSVAAALEIGKPAQCDRPVWIGGGTI